MKFEKLNENKIRIILSNQDLADKNIDFNSFMSNSAETQTLFLDMLEEAEEKVGFITRDHKIKIEALAMADGDFVVTVTRFGKKDENDVVIPNKNKKIKVRRKTNTSSVSIVETLHFIEKSYNIQYIIMYSKDELSAKSVLQLKDLAKEIGVKIKSGDNKETIIYTILDALAEASADGAAQKRKRTRIASKKEDRVYSVHGIEGENFDVMKNQVNGPAATDTTTEGDTPQAIPASVDPLAAFPKHRGRKSKAELEAIAAAKAAAIKMQQEGMKAAENTAELPTENADHTDNTESPTEQATVSEEEAMATALANNEQPTEEAPVSDNQETEIPEAQFTADGSGNDNSELIAMLQAKMNAHNENSTPAEPKENNTPESAVAETTPDGIWSGDPGDGTDFITVVDLPIEDQAAMPTYDIFDRPMTPAATAAPASAQAPKEVSQEPEYDFTDIISANGVLEVLSDGYGFLRSSDFNYLSSPDDIYVATNFVKRYGLKTGDVIQCHVRPPHEGENLLPAAPLEPLAPLLLVQTQKLLHTP